MRTLSRHWNHGWFVAAIATACALASRTTVAQASQPEAHSVAPSGVNEHVEPHGSPDPGGLSEPIVPTPLSPDVPRSDSAPREEPMVEEPDSEPEAPVAAPRRRPTTGHVAPQYEVERRPGDPTLLQVPGMTGAWFYRPHGGGRRARVLVYLHARNADPRESCRTFHAVASRFGWLLCPIGPVDRGSGRREWRNDRDYANRETIAALIALSAQFPGRVRRHDNVIMGFSEGAYVGMSVGLMNPRTFPRWFIIAADDRYIDAERERIHRAAGSVQRVFLLTGESDGVVERTRRAYQTLGRAWGHRHLRMQVLAGAGHELPPEFTRIVRSVLFWVAGERATRAESHSGSDGAM